MSVKKRDKKKKRQLRLKGISGKIKPTERDIKIAEGLAKGMKKGEALIAAGVSPANAKSNSKELTETPGVRAALAEALKKANVNIDRIAQTINEGLSATKVISATLVMVNEQEKDKPIIIDATEKKADEEEDEIVTRHLIRVEDYSVRHKFVDTSIELLERIDAFPSKSLLVTEERVTITEEQNMIAAAEAAASQRDTSRYMVKRERQI